LVEAAKAINRASDGYCAWQVPPSAASKVVGPSHCRVSAQRGADAKNRTFFYRKAYSEWKEDKSLFATTDADRAECPDWLSRSQRVFARELPNYPIVEPKSKNDKLKISDIAVMADLEWLYKQIFQAVLPIHSRQC